MGKNQWRLFDRVTLFIGHFKFLLTQVSRLAQKYIYKCLLGLQAAYRMTRVPSRVPVLRVFFFSLSANFESNFAGLFSDVGLVSFS